MKLKRHSKFKGLRKITKKIKDLYPHLNMQEKICTPCRQAINAKCSEQPVDQQNTPEQEGNSL